MTPTEEGPQDGRDVTWRTRKQVQARYDRYHPARACGWTHGALERRCLDDYRVVPVGTGGTVGSHDAIDTLDVAWDNGARPGRDDGRPHDDRRAGVVSSIEAMAPRELVRGLMRSHR